MPALSSRQAKRNKEQGYEVEDRARKELEAAGWWVERFYASKGTFDIIACRGPVTRLIQIKSSKRYIVAAESVRTAYLEDVLKMELVEFHPEIRHVELWVWFGKQKTAKDKGYRPAGWRKFFIRKGGILEVRE